MSLSLSHMLRPWKCMFMRELHALQISAPFNTVPVSKPLQNHGRTACHVAMPLRLKIACHCASCTATLYCLSRLSKCPDRHSSRRLHLNTPQTLQIMDHVNPTALQHLHQIKLAICMSRCCMIGRHQINTNYTHFGGNLLSSPPLQTAC